MRKSKLAVGFYASMLCVSMATTTFAVQTTTNHTSISVEKERKQLIIDLKEAGYSAEKINGKSITFLFDHSYSEVMGAFCYVTPEESWGQIEQWSEWVDSINSVSVTIPSGTFTNADFADDGYALLFFQQYTGNEITIKDILVDGKSIYDSKGTSLSYVDENYPDINYRIRGVDQYQFCGDLYFDGNGHLWELTNPNLPAVTDEAALLNAFEIHEYTKGKGETWDVDGNKLILKGFEYTNKSGSIYELALAADTELVLADGTENAIHAYGSCVSLVTDLPGSGQYHYQLGENSSVGIIGLGPVTISGKGSLTIDGCTEGIIMEGSLTIKDGDINIITDNGDYFEDSVGITALDFNMSGGKLTCQANDTLPNFGVRAIGIGVGGDVNITGGTIETKVTGVASSSNYAFLVYGDGKTEKVKISNATLIAVSEGATDDERAHGIGIYQGEVEINDANITATGGKGDYSYGFFSSNHVTISGGKIIATGADGKESAGIVAPSLTITGGNITANTGIGTEEKIAYWVYDGKMTLSGNAVVSADADVYAEGGIVAKRHNVTGANEKFVSGTTQELTAKAGSKIEFKPQNVTPETPANDNPFIDVKNGKYYTESILYLNEKGVMTGLNKTTFGFNSLLKREDMVTLLWKNEGQPDMKTSGEIFKDVKSGKYYSNAVAWAKEYNIVGGYTTGAKAGCFGKGDTITRQDFIKIIYGYAKFKGYDTSVKSATTYTEKSDASKVAKYARESMNWAYEKGLVGQGSPLDPKGNIKRQDAAVIIARFLKAFDK